MEYSDDPQIIFHGLSQFFEIVNFRHFDSVCDWTSPDCFNPSFWRYSNRKRDERRLKSEIPDNISQQEISRSVPIVYQILVTCLQFDLIKELPLNTLRVSAPGRKH